MPTTWETKNRSGGRGWSYEESDLLYEMTDLFYESYKTPTVWTERTKHTTNYTNPSRTSASWSARAKS